MTMQEIIDAIYGAPHKPGDVHLGHERKFGDVEDAAVALDKKEEALLDQRAAAHKPKLDWRGSIVDLLEVLNKPSDIKAREALAKELHYPGPFDGSAKMNEFLHKHVMERLGVH